MHCHKWQLLGESGGPTSPEGLDHRQSRVVGRAGWQDRRRGSGEPGDGRGSAKHGWLAWISEPDLQPLQQLPCF